MKFLLLSFFLVLFSCKTASSTGKLASQDVKSKESVLEALAIINDAAFKAAFLLVQTDKEIVGALNIGEFREGQAEHSWLRSDAYRSIAEATGPIAKSILKGLGLMSIGPSVLSGISSAATAPAGVGIATGQHPTAGAGMPGQFPEFQMAIFGVAGLVGSAGTIHVLGESERIGSANYLANSGMKMAYVRSAAVVVPLTIIGASIIYSVNEQSSFSGSDSSVTIARKEVNKIVDGLDTNLTAYVDGLASIFVWNDAQKVFFKTFLKNEISSMIANSEIVIETKREERVVGSTIVSQKLSFVKDPQISSLKVLAKAAQKYKQVNNGLDLLSQSQFETLLLHTSMVQAMTQPQFKDQLDAASVAEYGAKIEDVFTSPQASRQATEKQMANLVSINKKVKLMRDQGKWEADVKQRLSKIVEETDLAILRANRLIK